MDTAPTSLSADGQNRPTVRVAEWLALAEKDRDEKTAWLAEDFVLVTNYGDGPAYDIKLSGSNCRPRVRLRDTGRQR